jgi:hypothetical protein
VDGKDRNIHLKEIHVERFAQFYHAPL